MPNPIVVTLTRAVVAVASKYQMERITAILDPEDAHQEAVHAKHYPSPYENRSLLHLRIRHARNLDRKCDRRE